MSNVTLICRNATTFKPNGDLDEEAFRAYLQRFIDAKLGYYLASGGSGEGHTLNFDEQRRVYEIGVEMGKGKVYVGSNQPEVHTASGSIELAKIAINAGVDVVNIYGPSGWHGYKATDVEYVRYFDRVFEAIDYPTALCPNPILGYMPPPSCIAEVIGKHSQVVAVNLSGVKDDIYFVDLYRALPRPVEIYVPYQWAANALQTGATGLLGAEANFVPKTFRHYIDCYEAGKLEEASLAYDDLKRVTQYVEQWKGTSPRWIKMALRAFKLPGGEGGIREPYVMLEDDEVKRFADGAIKLNVAEINDMARAAGLI